LRNESFDGANLSQPGNPGMLWIDEKRKNLPVKRGGQDKFRGSHSTFDIGDFLIEVEAALLYRRL
jgi:hypothetical protein